MTKRFVRSWDVFDTLIARRCVHPYAIFDLMEAALGDGFRSDRMKAEVTARASRPEISLGDIYDALQAARGWSAEQRRLALELELRLESENVIPVAENLARVRDGDLLVSDMYLPPEAIMGLLRRAGLAKDVELFVSTDGKGDGTMWKRLRARYRIVKHTGDDPRRDFLKPLSHGIPAGLTEAAAETAWERLLRCNGAPALAAFVREMRLRAFHEDAAARTLQRAQVEANFPLLLLASAALVQWCREHGISRALMASRDCVLWAPLAEKVAQHAGGGLAVEYFLISRVAALKSSGRYLEYAARRITADAVVVDLSMTGVSLAGLADRLGIGRVRAFVLSWQQSIARSLYGERFQPKARVEIESLMAELPHHDLEAFNQALTPSIHDVSETGDRLELTYASENRPRAVLEAIAIQNAAFTEMLERVPAAVLGEALQLACGNRLVFLVRECERHAGSFETVVTRASPGAALWNDPNGIALNLPYVTSNPAGRWLAQGLKRVLKPLVRPGSTAHRYGKVLVLVLGRLRAAKQ
jgi:hypothetical protein